MSTIGEFWGRVNAALIEYDESGYARDVGYFKIVAHGREYRSVGPDEYGKFLWVCWEPWEVVGHFSQLSDPDGSIEWVPLAAQSGGG